MRFMVLCCGMLNLFRCAVDVNSCIGFEVVNVACVVADAVLRLSLCPLQLL